MRPVDARRTRAACSWPRCRPASRGSGRWCWLRRRRVRMATSRTSCWQRRMWRRSMRSIRGGIVETRDLDEAVELANAFAGEHLCLAIRDPWTWLGKVRHAGGVFLGELNAEAIGDYTAGPSHIMPTGGTARFSSPVNVDDFLKIISVFGLGPEDLRQAGPPYVILASVTSLDTHARALRCMHAALSSATPRPA